VTKASLPSQRARPSDKQQRYCGETLAQMRCRPGIGLQFRTRPQNKQQSLNRVPAVFVHHGHVIRYIVVEVPELAHDDLCGSISRSAMNFPKPFVQRKGRQPVRKVILHYLTQLVACRLA
jgi:hypothetical protein